MALSAKQAKTSEQKQEVLNLVLEYWEYEPGVRLGQLISNMLTGKTTTDRDRDLYYMDDNKFMDRLRDVYGGE